jgi:hypothetical protein
MRLLQGSVGELLRREITIWALAGRTPRFFLRDDDAVSETPALRRLFWQSEQAAAPLLLATIPEPADDSLGRAVRAFGLATGAVHGFSHRNNAPKGEKTCELDRHRDISAVLGELRQGRAKLIELFAGRLSGLLVPPWNRIHDEVASQVQTAGFLGISAHGWLKEPAPHALGTVNAHIDIIHWSGGRVGRSPDWVAGELATNLREARLRGWRAIGILTHHLDHDDAAWAVLGDIFELARLRGIGWVSADALIQEPAEKPGPLHPHA